ncbi:MAG: hypothetical protein KAI17_14140 [Thiotrichaceae bacterium]|nr:hypothetical protein [Thiotrichaceae bacterium]
MKAYLIIPLVLTAYLGTTNVAIGGTYTSSYLASCYSQEHTLRSLLEARFSKADKKGLYKRRVTLRKVFNRLTPTCAKKMRRLLGVKDKNYTISVLFHRKLARAARKELLSILDSRILKTPKIIEGDIELGVTDDQIKRAAGRAKRILSELKVTSDNWRSVKSLKCIVNEMSMLGKSFNDSYYPVAPKGKNTSHLVNPKTCYTIKNRRTGDYDCRKGKNVIKYCKKSLSKVLVNSNEAGFSDHAFLERLLFKEDAINRGLDYFRNIRNISRNIAGSKSYENTMLCPQVVTHLLPKMSNRYRSSIYNCYQNL